MSKLRRHPTGGSRSGSNDARADRNARRHAAGILGGRQRLRVGGELSLAWLVKHKGIAPHIPVFDKSNRPMARSPGPISSLTPTATVTSARREKNWFSSDEPMRPPGAASRPRAQDSIVPANWIAMSANSKPVLSERGRPQDPERPQRRRPRCGSCVRRNSGIRGGLSSAEESRDAVRPSSVSFASRACGSEVRIFPRGHRPKPETTRPTKIDE
jgi:hypothetical protein